MGEVNNHKLSILRAVPGIWFSWKIPYMRLGLTWEKGKFGDPEPAEFSQMVRDGYLDRSPGGKLFHRTKLGDAVVNNQGREEK